MNRLIMSVTHKVPLSQGNRSKGNLFVSIKTLKLAAPTLP